MYSKSHYEQCNVCRKRYCVCNGDISPLKQCSEFVRNESYMTSREAYEYFCNVVHPAVVNGDIASVDKDKLLNALCIAESAISCILSGATPTMVLYDGEDSTCLVHLRRK